jgi:hypothetical protein
MVFMALNFPSNPQIGDTYLFKNVSYIYNGVGWAPQALPTPNDAPVYVSDCPPNGAKQGSLWYQASTGLLWLYYVDSGGGQWVTAAPLPDGVLTEFGGWTVTGPSYFSAPILEDNQPVTLGYFLEHTISDLGGTVNGPLFLTAPINPNALQQAITVGFVSNMLRAGNGLSIDPVTKFISRFDCGSFIPA